MISKPNLYRVLSLQSSLLYFITRHNSRRYVSRPFNFMSPHIITHSLCVIFNYTFTPLHRSCIIILSHPTSQTLLLFTLHGHHTSHSHLTLHHAVTTVHHTCTTVHYRYTIKLLYFSPCIHYLSQHHTITLTPSQAPSRITQSPQLTTVHYSSPQIHHRIILPLTTLHIHNLFQHHTITPPPSRTTQSPQLITHSPPSRSLD